MNAQRGVLLLVIRALSFLTFRLVEPYLSFVIGALLLAYVLTPLQTRLEDRFRPTTAAGLLVAAATLAVLLPFVALVVTVAGEAATIARDLAADDVAAQLQAPEAWLNSRLGRDVDLSSEIAARLEGVAETVVGTAPDLVASLTHLTIGLGLSVFLLFYLLRDGDRLVDWLQTITPLPQSMQSTLYDRIDNMTRAVLLGHVLVAIIQGSIAGLGLVAVGISNALFWTVLMILLSLLPFVGAFLIWGPAAVWLASTGRLPAAVFLFVWSCCKAV
jgi:predicted PurR-regulated permease PerM